VVVDYHRRHGGEVLKLLVGDLFAPALLAGVRVEGDKPSVGAHEVEPVAVHADAAVADEVAAVVDPIVLPEELALARVDGENVVGDGEVEDSVDQQRRGLDHRVADAALRTDAADLVGPGGGQRGDVGGVDLGERAVASSGVIAL